MAGKRILVVDDEKIVNLDIQATLKRLGYIIAGDAGTGKEAIEKVTATLPDLVLMDIKLQGEMDGIEAASVIIKTHDIPIVFLTAFSDEKTLCRAKLSGPFGYLLKPFEERELRSSIEIALYKHGMEQEYRQAVADAEAANEAKSSFLATISHELRTPMNGILGLSEILLGSGLASEQQEYVELIKGSASSLLRVLNDMLDYSKIERRILELREGAFDIRQILSLVVNSHSPNAENKGLTMECFLHPDISGELQGDSGRLTQILNNIVSNAIKYTDKGGITIEVMPDDCDVDPYPAGCIRLLFVVSDTGVGISRSKADSIFESFTQLEDYMTRKHGGIGLGLAITHNLVNMLQGVIWVDTKPAQGSSFYFTAVFRPVDEELAEKPEDSVYECINFSQFKRVMLADDNIITRRVVSAFLEDANCELEMVENGRDAISLLARKSFDLVIMDVQMPVMDGLEATRLIRTGYIEGVNPQIPILALTAHAMKGDRERCLDVGMNGYLSKPFNSSELMQAMLSIVQGGENSVPVMIEQDTNVEKSLNLDLKGTIKRLDGNDKLVREIYRHFLQLVPLHLAKVDKAVLESDLECLKCEIALLRGLSLDVGAHKLSSLALEIEKFIQHGSMNTVEGLVSRMKREADNTFAVMSDYIFKST
ncbi:hybrid sensor histidine kinase/response regulator [Desulfovibrio sp. JC022]|uniref:hybrid sensor histidine kinase/response regulator n=1 Tax=Desulfovibrio sp. JC022 TaxID=2593642 RepID=UPI0013D848CF|nr:hybrid sensor histidine kinase/response regulator [Desulfovibrio sp. JC022]NDV23530.1 response regulator [Desulfovibrio sp. JC022]